MISKVQQPDDGYCTFFLSSGLVFVHAPIPMHEVVPSAVTIAVAIDAIICTMNLMVSFLLIVGFHFKWLILIFVVTIPHTLCHLERSLLPVISSVVERSALPLGLSKKSHSEIEDLSMRYA